MGKASKLKRIRKAARQLPVMQTRHIQGERVSGAELFKEGVKEVNGKPIDIDASYSKKIAVPVPVNHNRQMKKMFNKYGMPGAAAYAKQIQTIEMAGKLKKQIEEAALAEETEPEELRK